LSRCRCRCCCCLLSESLESSESPFCSILHTTGAQPGHPTGNCTHRVSVGCGECHSQQQLSVTVAAAAV
jgi:hypothetical protein